MDMMSLLQMINSFGGIKNKLIQLGINPSDLQNVNFNDPASLNELAAKVMPGLLKARPDIANQIKQQASTFAPDKGAEIIDMIGNGSK